MRECRNNYAHGPMKLKATPTTVQYRGREITCEKLVYVCNFCDYQQHEQWMEDKFAEQLAKAYNENDKS